MNAAHADCDAQGNGVSPAVCVEMRLLWAIIWFAASQEETAEVVTDVLLLFSSHLFPFHHRLLSLYEGNIWLLAVLPLEISVCRFAIA